MNLADIRPFVMLELPGCPTPVIDSATLITLRDFMRATKVWKTTLTEVDWAEPLVLTVPVGAEISLTEKVYDRTNRTALPFMTAEQLRDQTELTWSEPNANPIAWTMEGGVTPVIYPSPAATADVTGRLDVTVVYNAAKDAATAAIPDWLWEKYEEAFTYGTLARLLRIPGKDWTNPQQAAAYGNGFTALKQQAKAEAVADFGRPTRVVRYGGY